jgi:hypothetical protein
VFIYPIPEAVDTSNDTCFAGVNDSEELRQMFEDDPAEEDKNNTLEFSPVCNHKNKKYSRLDESSIVEANA